MSLINIILFSMWTHQFTLQQCHRSSLSLFNTIGNRFNIGIVYGLHRLHSFFDPWSSSIAMLIWALRVFYGRWQSLTMWPYFPQLYHFPWKPAFLLTVCHCPSATPRSMCACPDKLDAGICWRLTHAGAYYHDWYYKLRCFHHCEVNQNIASALSAASIALFISFGNVSITYYYTCGFSLRRKTSSKSWTDITVSTSIISMPKASLYLVIDVVQQRSRSFD